ncbi:MAG: tyrosine-type recombinase/integrase [Gemmataceae bacterium]
MPKSLSDAAVRNAKAKTKPYKMSDGDGLFLLVTPSGSKYWRLKYFFANKEKLLALGVYPDVSLTDARERRGQARKVLAAGRDPGEAKKEAKRLLLENHESTFEAVAREWHRNRLSKWTPLYGKKTLSRLEMHVFSRLGARPIADITPQELLSAMRKVEERGADIAHRVLQICGQIFSYAVITQRATNNPAASLRGALTPWVKTNHAYIKPNELQDYLKNLEAYAGALQTKLAMKFLLLTFVRTGELRGAAWSEIDFDKAEWRIPAERMKMKDPHIVPLSRQAIAILKELQPITGQWRFVFPNQHKPSGHMSENTILYALYRMGYHSRATGHGFRSTASTVLNENGFPPDVIERQLAHSERNSVRAAYNHAQYLPERRKMMQWWADYLDEVAAKK